MIEHDRLTVGQILDGKYEIEAVIDRGGMGIVYRAQHLGLGAPRAIKLMHRKFAESEDFLRRFRNEARLAEGLHHPNLVTLYDLSVFPDGTMYLVLEYVEGRPLSSLIQQGLSLGFADIGTVIGQAADGLAFAHAQKIIHRDISPDNLMLARDRDARIRVKVLDFGIAKAFGDVSGVDAQRTATGMFLGKIGFCSPEQIGLSEHEELDQRTDVFSLAVVAYRLLSGTLPFNTSSIRTYVYEITMAPEVEVRERFERDLPTGFRDVIARALCRDRTLRTASVAQFKAELAEAIARSKSALPSGKYTSLAAIDLKPKSSTDDTVGIGVTVKAGSGVAGVDAATVILPPMSDVSTGSQADPPDPATATFDKPITTRRPKPERDRDPYRWLWLIPGGLVLLIAGLWFWGAGFSRPHVNRVANEPATSSKSQLLPPRSLDVPADVASSTIRAPSLEPPIATTSVAQRKRATTSSSRTTTPAHAEPRTTTSAPALTTVPASTPSFPPPAPPPAIVSLRSRPSAEAILDGQSIGTTPLELEVSPGDHRLELQAPGPGKWIRHFVARPGETTAFDTRLDAYGSLSVTADVWANIRLDGTNMEQTPVFFRRVVVGAHTVSVTRPGYREQSLTVDVKEGETASVRITMETQS